MEAHSDVARCGSPAPGPGLLLEGTNPGHASAPSLAPGDDQVRGASAPRYVSRAAGHVFPDDGERGCTRSLWSPPTAACTGREMSTLVSATKLAGNVGAASSSP